MSSNKASSPVGGEEGGASVAAAATSSSDGLFDEVVLRDLFNRLDHSNTGVLDVDDVSRALKLLGVPASRAAVQSFMQRLGIDNKNCVTYPEFVAFFMIHEEALHMVYQTFHAPDASTRTSASELRRALKKLGVHLTRGEATALHHDIVANQAYDFAAFCTALLLLPAHNRTELFTEWLEENGFDDGEAIHVPEDGSWRTVVSAGVGSVTSRTLTAPMDRIKILMQAQVSASSQAKAPGIVDVYRRILREGGWRAFWRGNGTNCIKIAPETAVKMYVFENVRDAIAKDPSDVTMAEGFMAGAIAGSTAQTAIYPLEIAKTRLALARTGQYSGIQDCLGTLLRNEGPRYLFRGLVASLCGIVPYAGTELTTITALNKLWGKTFPDKQPTPLVYLGTGIVASVAGMSVAYPLNLVRTRLQAQGGPGRQVLYSGVIDCLRKTLEADGFRGLYRGLGPNMLKAVPAMGISYAVFATMKTAL